MPRFRTSSNSRREFVKGKHRFEHWYRDNTVYFITSRCRDRLPAFTSEEAKSVFWKQFDHYTQHFGFVPWVTTLLNNHYHTLGYLKVGENLGPMMQRIHGSISKLVNDILPERQVPFCREGRHNDYFDGCIRDELQCARAYRYTLTQSVRHRLSRDYRHYPHTRVGVDVERGMKRALELKAFLHEVPYPRYGQQSRSSG